MRAMSAASTATTATSSPPDSGPNLSTSQLFSPPPPPPPALSISAADQPTPRRIKSKSSLRSIRSLGSSSHHEDDVDESHEPGSDKSLIRPSILRRLSPGLAARVKLLDGSNKTNNPSRIAGAVGRIPEEHIKELDSLHQNLSLSIKVEKRGRAWNAIPRLHKDKKQQSASGYLEVPDPELPEEIPEELEEASTPYSDRLLDLLLGQEQQERPEPTLTEEVIEEPAPEVPTRTEEVIEEPEPEVPITIEEVIEEELEEEPEEEPEEQLEEQLEEQPEEQPEEPALTEQVAEEQLEEIEEVVEEPVMSLVQHAPVPLVPGPATHSDLSNQTDYEKYIQSTSDSKSHPPPPPPKECSRPTSTTSSNSQSFFNPLGLQRTESIYSFSRASFSNQLSQLTSISLPQPASLEASIASIATAQAAVRALTGAAEQIQIWVKKASDVLGGLDAEDEVEWAAAAGREGLEGVDKAIIRFESLINVYVRAIEAVQLRDDIGSVSTDSLQTIVVQMDAIIQSWAEIKGRLRGVKEQVELAMEWEELWANVLGDVGAEVESLSELIFEMEEKRHWTLAGEQDSSASGLDLNELETIVEETPSNRRMLSSKRLSIDPILTGPPALDTPVIQTPQDDTNHSNLIALFARIQPLRASLDFLPMRLSMFQSRAERIFPSACRELEDRQNKLEKCYQTLEAEADALQKELNEDRWILVFRNAGSQAQKMFDSVERSIAKLQEAMETGMHIHDAPLFTKRIESYEAKKQHYVAAIERVVGIIRKGVNDRLTVNGETLRLLSDMTSRVDALKASIRAMDDWLEDINFVRSQHLRDSISSIVTMDSHLTGSVADTPGSSPASSVVMTPANPLKGSATPLGTSSRRGSSVSSAARTTMSKIRRYSGIPQAAAATLTSKKSALPKATTLTAPSPSRAGAVTPTPATRKSARPMQTPSTLTNRPRWNASTNTNDLYSKPNPSPFRKPGASSRPASTIPFRRDMSMSPGPMTARSVSRVSSRLASRSPVRQGSPTPGGSILDPPPYSKLRRPEGLSNAPRSRQSYAGLSFSRSVSHDYDRGLASPTKAPRPGTALGHSGNRRISLIPLPKNKETTSHGERPPWRYSGR
ncbi:KAR9-domain-containing protein [Aspergillus sclerotiicarbonarius CBS 121057]|uniref:KAR9-domain-containing protein n=1 Tax=Aspergillus sclerotiicarbonarius (strain CBS 121057 / IBT 28362) TaxID=1448318 RepID=A0A319ETD5_ASPSB|nr:KAR9-domain-containing protein [Aspergillus sclerotiicarbonarius CBS 121057]